MTHAEGNLSQAMNTIFDEHNGYAVVIPESAAGQTVNIRSGARNDIHVMHAETPDQSTIYFEVTAYPSVRAHDALVAAQRTFLADNATGETIGDVRVTILSDRPATTFDFEGFLQGRIKTRRFCFVDTARTYRVVYDPTSARNEAVLTTLRFLADDPRPSR